VYFRRASLAQRDVPVNDVGDFVHEGIGVRHVDLQPSDHASCLG
jgi:hypothetical protein